MNAFAYTASTCGLEDADMVTAMMITERKAIHIPNIIRKDIHGQTAANRANRNTGAEEDVSFRQKSVNPLSNTKDRRSNNATGRRQECSRTDIGYAR